MSSMYNAGKESEAENVAGGSSAQVIPLHGPGRDKPVQAQALPDPAERPAEEVDARPDAPVVSFPAKPVPGAADPASGDWPDEVRQAVPPAVLRAITFIRNRLTGDYTIDEFGFDPELTDALLLPPLRALYEKWFRVCTTGVEHLPAEGGALLVCNHSGTLPLDALMTAVAVHDEHPAHRHLRGLGADLLFQIPLVGALARKSGQTLACNPDAERLLRGGELVGVWPEGFKGIGKPFSSRYKLQRFGRGRDANRGAHNPVLDRRCGGDLPEARRHQAAGPAARPAVLPGDTPVPTARPARRRPAAHQVVHRVRRADPH
jgi:hypothetical protein